MQLNPSEISELIKTKIQNLETGAEVRTQGTVVSLSDGIARTVPTPYLGNGYVHEAIEAQRCWKAGLIESPGMTHADSLALMGVMDEVRRQIGVSYAADLAAKE